MFDFSRLFQLLGPFIIEECEGGPALAITLDDISTPSPITNTYTTNHFLCIAESYFHS
jgi:acetamidase/formamidase